MKERVTERLEEKLYKVGKELEEVDHAMMFNEYDKVAFGALLDKEKRLKSQIAKIEMELEKYQAIQTS